MPWNDEHRSQPGAPWRCRAKQRTRLGPARLADRWPHSFWRRTVLSERRLSPRARRADDRVRALRSKHPGVHGTLPFEKYGCVVQGMRCRECPSVGGDGAVQLYGQCPPHSAVRTVSCQSIQVLWLRCNATSHRFGCMCVICVWQEPTNSTVTSHEMCGTA